MAGILILILSLVTLYVLAGIFIKKFYIVIYRMTRDRDDAAVILGWIFIPGTFIHEIAHLLMALILIVPFGQLNLMPEVQEDGVKLGSVQIGKTDFIRGSLVGLAPIIAGGAIIFAAISYSLMHLNVWWVIVILIYLIFEITHTMFSSKRDLYAVLELVVFIILISAAFVIFKIYAPFTFIYQEILKAGPFIQKFSYFLFIPIVLELIFLAFFRKIRI